MKKISAFVLMFLLMNVLASGATYYSQGSLQPEIVNSWNDIRTGGGNSPVNFTSGDIFLVQGGHSMTNEASWSVSGSGSELGIENGGSLTANFPVTLAKTTLFRIEDGGTFIHNNTGTPSSTIFNGMESFSTASTFWIKNWAGNLYVIPNGITWGNLIIDVPTLSGSWNQVGNITTVNGTLEIRQTGGNSNEFRLCSRNNNTYVFTLANLSVSGGILNIQGGGTSGTPSMTTTVTGNINLTGGELDLGTNGTSFLNVNGNLSVSGTGSITSSGTGARIVFCRNGEQTVALTEGAMNTNMINIDINPGSVVNMSTCWFLSPLSTMNLFGTLKTNSYTLKPRVLNVGGILNMGDGILEQTGAGAIMVGGPGAGNTGIINCSGTINMAPSSLGSFLIQPGGTLNLDNGVVNMNHSLATFFIDTGGTLNCGSGIVKSVNSTTPAFILNPGGTLLIGSEQGIGLTGPVGNIQVAGSRNYHYAANYVYNGATAQFTGDGLPSEVRNLSINNSAGVTLTGSIQVDSSLSMISGRLLPGGKTVSYGESAILRYSGEEYTCTGNCEFPVVNGPGSLVIENSPAAGITLGESRIIEGNLTIADTKKLLVPSGVHLTVRGLTTLHGTECLAISPGGSFIDGGIPGEGTGTACVGMTVAAGAWHYISSPVQSSLSGIFSGDYLKHYDEGSLAFGANIVSTSVPLDPVSGYALWPVNDQTIIFHGGKLNTGTRTTAVSRTYTGQDGNAEYDGWNLVGNPYPCGVDLDSICGSWVNTEETAYFWDQSSAGSGNYSVYPAKTGFGTHSPCVPATQGFFVHCNAPATHTLPGSGTVSFCNASKVHTAEPFLKTGRKIPNTLFMKVTGSSNTWSDEVVVHFDSLCTPGYDPGFDALKLWGLPDAPQLYTSSAGLDLTVNVLPFAKDDITVPLCFKSGIPGKYRAKADSIGTFGSNCFIQLEDQKTGCTRDLKTSPEYDFVYETQDPPDRFLLHFNKQQLAVSPGEPGRTIIITTGAAKLLILDSSGVPFSGEIFVYDLLGREYFHATLRNELVDRLEIGLRAGTFLVKVVSNEGLLSRIVNIH